MPDRKFLILALILASATGRPQDPQAIATTGDHGSQPPSDPAAGHQAAPQGDHPVIQILSRDFKDDGAGNFKWSYEASDGSKAEQEGHTIPPQGDSTDSIQVIQGSYSYVGPDGKTYMLSYIADQNGFQPKADFLPQAPVDPNVKAGADAGAAPAHSAPPQSFSPPADSSQGLPPQ